MQNLRKIRQLEPVCVPHCKDNLNSFIEQVLNCPRPDHLTQHPLHHFADSPYLMHHVKKEQTGDIAH